MKDYRAIEFECIYKTDVQNQFSVSTACAAPEILFGVKHYKLGKLCKSCQHRTLCQTETAAFVDKSGEGSWSER